MVLVGLLDEKGYTAILCGDDANGLFRNQYHVVLYALARLSHSRVRDGRTLLAIWPSFCFH